MCADSEKITATGRMVIVSTSSVDIDEIRRALADEFRSGAQEARRRIEAIIDPVRPTPAFMTALAAELERAVAAPDTVPYPELADPDRYWAASVQPQVKACRDHIAAVLTWLESQVIQTMGVAEEDLKRVVDVAIADRGANPVADRAALGEALQGRCNELHHQMGELLLVVPERGPLEAATSAYTEAVRHQAQIDVDGLKLAYLADAGGDDDHQRFAEQQWSQTYGERVAHREAQLAAEPPWRHQYLALAGYERALLDAEVAVEALVARLQSPLGDLPGLLLERFDAALTT